MKRHLVFPAAHGLALAAVVSMLGCVNYTPMAVPPPPKPPPDEAASSETEMSVEEAPPSSTTSGPHAASPIEISGVDRPPVRMLPRLRVALPKAGHSVRGEVVGQTEVEVTSAGGPPTRLWLGIDDRAPVELGRAAPQTLGALFGSPELPPGRHTLIAVATDAEGHVLRGERGSASARRDFWVGPDQPGGPAEPALFVAPLRFRGDALWIDWIAVGVELAEGGVSVEVRVSPADGRIARHRSHASKPLTVRGLPAGEVKVMLSLQRADGTRLPGTLTQILHVVDAPRGASTFTTFEEPK